VVVNQSEVLDFGLVAMKRKRGRMGTIVGWW
jgi:hypothetical protein